MGVATVVEKFHGTEYVYSRIYGTLWFCYIWAVMACLGIIGIFKTKLYRNLPLMFVHVSFIVILAGAGLTKAFAKHGYFIATKNVYSSLMHHDEKVVELPFGVRLDTFFVSYYPGTDAPADYTSRISIRNRSGEISRAQISMNRTHTHEGYRFYQSSFENDMNTSIFKVNHDETGVYVTYAGYLLFALAMLWFLFDRRNIFRALLRHPLLRKTIASLVGICLTTGLFSQTVVSDSTTVAPRQAEAFGNLWVLSEGRIMPMFSLAREFTRKITGQDSFGNMGAMEFMTGILFFPEKWENVPLFEITSPELRAELNIKGSKASPADFYDGNERYRLSRYRADLNSAKTKSPLLKEVEQLNDRIQLMGMLSSGFLLKIYPLEVEGRREWVHPGQNIQIESQDDRMFIDSSLPDYYAKILEGNEAAALDVLEDIKNFQIRKAGKLLPSASLREVERLYINANLTSLLFKVNLAGGILALFALLIPAGGVRTFALRLFGVLTVAAFLVHSFSIALRTCIGGRLPFGNGYETMLLVAWCALLVASLFGRRVRILTPFGLLLSGCVLLVAHIGSMNPKITPLVPVLSSPLLSIHVSVIMLSYTLLGFVALNSLLSFVLILVSRKGKEQELVTMLERNRIYGLVCLYPAVFLLGAGIFVGAVWANMSWGRYWGWDPKEVWALITFMIYGLVFHRNMRLMNNTFAFHAFGLYAFASVLMTYFGVNYILGGMHSYAGEMQLGKTGLTAGIVLLSLIAFTVLARWKYKKLVISD
jgi:ABC-type transport system involved in cytochrome c biogenesis permease subunit